MPRRLDPALIRTIGPFYHVTSASNANAILIEGLRPEKWDKPMYSATGLTRPFCCLSPLQHRNRYIPAIREKFAVEETVVLEISIEGALQGELQLDDSSAEAEQQGFDLRFASIPELVECGAPLASYSTIHPDHIQVVERYPPKEADRSESGGWFVDWTAPQNGS